MAPKFDRRKTVHEKYRFEKCVCFGFLDNSVIVQRLKWVESIRMVLEL